VTQRSADPESHRTRGPRPGGGCSLPRARPPSKGSGGRAACSTRLA